MGRGKGIGRHSAPPRRMSAVIPTLPKSPMVFSNSLAIAACAPANPLRAPSGPGESRVSAWANMLARLVRLAPPLPASSDGTRFRSLKTPLQVANTAHLYLPTPEVSPPVPVISSLAVTSTLLPPPWPPAVQETGDQVSRPEAPGCDRTLPEPRLFGPRSRRAPACSASRSRCRRPW